mmetsp:Transcript_16638/g.31514  ORF Transcript_16638/g.31514 Transcript_16638/m.31514 type:complete len:1040 (+) Transcript_16638:98-3217(+)
MMTSTTNKTVAVKAYDLGDEEGNDHNIENNPQKELYKKSSFFSDDHGNLKMVNFICRYPVRIFIFIIILCNASVIILGQLALRDGNPITEDTNAYDIHDIRSIAYDTLRLASNETNSAYITFVENGRRLNGESKLLQEDLGDVTYWIYKAKTSEGLFTKDSLSFMYETEATILQNKVYPDYCYAEYNVTVSPPTKECTKPLSVMNIYFASLWDEALADEIINMFKSDPTKIQMYNDLAPCVEAGFFCDLLPPIYTEADKLWVKSTSDDINSMIVMWDGQGQLNSNVDQVTEFIAYMNELVTKRSKVNFYFDANFALDNKVSMFSRSIIYWGELLNGTTTVDESEKKLKTFILDNLVAQWDEKSSKNYSDKVQSYYFMGSLIWDLILQILLLDGLKALASFTAVFFYLRYMLGSWFLSAVGMFEIVMSLPLAWITFSYIFQIKYFSALNTLCIFIVMAIGADDIFVFMDAYKQSASKGPEVLSSLETRMSWVFRRSGSAMLLTTITTCCAFLCTLISPIAGTRSFGVFAAFVIFYDYLLVMILFCTSVVIYHNQLENKPNCCNCTFWRKCDPTPTDAALKRFEHGEEPHVDRISLFFKEKVGPFMLNVRNRIGIAIILLAWIVVSSIYTVKLEPTTSAEQFLDENHPLQIGVTILTDEFPKTQEDETSKIHFVWGLDYVSRDGVNQLLDPSFVGNAAFSSSFVFDESCQSALLDICTTLRTDPSLDEFILRKDGIKSVDCFLEQFAAYSVDPSSSCVDVRAGAWRNETWEVSSTDLNAAMSEFVTQTACGQGQKTVKEYFEDTLGWDGTSLRYVGISVDSNKLDPRGNLAEDIVREIYDKFIELAQEFDKTVEGACKTKTLMTDLDQKFVFMNNQRIYRTSAVSGSMVGVVFAFAVLFISTRKLHLSLFATLCVLSVLLGVIGCITMLGWTLGTIEAILISILAGFSVDYVIHLAHAYHHAEGDVDNRIKSAYGDMGISVFSGMVTSVVASIPLFFCTLTFFAKFGTFLCLTISLSWVFANFGFMCLLASFKIPMDKKCL